MKFLVRSPLPSVYCLVKTKLCHWRTLVLKLISVTLTGNFELTVNKRNSVNDIHRKKYRVIYDTNYNNGKIFIPSCQSLSNSLNGSTNSIILLFSTLKFKRLSSRVLERKKDVVESHNMSPLFCLMSSSWTDRFSSFLLRAPSFLYLNQNFLLVLNGWTLSFLPRMSVYPKGRIPSLRICPFHIPYTCPHLYSFTHILTPLHLVR